MFRNDQNSIPVTLGHMVEIWGLLKNPQYSDMYCTNYSIECASTVFYLIPLISDIEILEFLIRFLGVLLKAELRAKNPNIFTVCLFLGLNSKTCS